MFEFVTFIVSCGSCVWATWSMDNLDWKTKIAAFIGIASISEAYITIFEDPGMLWHGQKDSHFSRFETLKRIEIGCETTFR